MSNENEGAAAPAKPLDPGALDRAFEAWTRVAVPGTARPKLPRRSLSFLVDCGICSPGVFEDDFELTVTSLDSGTELACAQRAGADPVRLAMLLAFESLFAFNGRPLGVTHREWLWEALGSAGRNLVISQFGAVGTPGDEALGKASRSLRVG
jgi:hypothetical protein